MRSSSMCSRPGSEGLHSGMGSCPYLCGLTSAGEPGRRTPWQVLIRSADSRGVALRGISTGSPPARVTASAYIGQDLALYSRLELVGTGMAMRGFMADLNDTSRGTGPEARIGVDRQLRIP